MKKTTNNNIKKNTKWYLYTDGKVTLVANSRTEFDTLNGVVIEISANEAATILALKLKAKN